MEYRATLDFLPLWALFLISIGICAAALEAGHRLGNYRRKNPDPEKAEPVGVIVGATLGLLAFMLAFTFGLAATRYDDRREIVVNEANAIGTTYLRAEMLPEPHGKEVRKLLREYVDVRLEGTRLEKLSVALTKSGEIQNRLWDHAVVVGKQNPESLTVSLFISALNELIDIHSKRVWLALRTRVPNVIWLALFVVAILGMSLMGYHEGLFSNHRSLASVGLILTFSTVMLLIEDLDRSHEGLLRVSQQAMVDLKNSFPSRPGD